jgi:segregation and condensation protein A
MTYRVDLDNYVGPLDLLLYLIRKEEVEIQDIPILRITEQYVAYLNVLTSMDINVAGEFLVMAATLMEIKSRMILPRPEMPAEEGEEPEGDPRLELVRQLLEYKRFKDAAQDLEALGDEQLRRYNRPAAEIVIGPEEQRYALDEMMKDVQIWDLLSAFARIMQSINIAPREVVYDDTPIEQIAERLVALMSERRTALFSDVIHALFAGQETVARSHLIGAFLAILECIRRRLIAITQDEDFADLRLFWREDGGEPVIDRQDKLAPPEARITSREAARAADGLERPAGRFKDDFDRDDSQVTEFDDLLESIKIPDVETFKPIYSEDEVLGREAQAEGQSGTPSPPSEPPAPPPEGPEKPPDVPPAQVS